MKKFYVLVIAIGFLGLVNTVSGQNTFTATTNGAWSNGATWDINGVPSNPCVGCTITINPNVVVNLDISVHISGGSKILIGTDATSPAALLIPNSFGTSIATGHNILMDVSNPTNLIKLANVNTSVIAIAAGTFDGVFSDFDNGFVLVKIIGKAPTNFVDGLPIDNNTPERSFLAGPVTINAQNVLPVVLANFNAVLAGKVVNLSWETLEEVNSDHFGIERSADASHWQNIGTVAAKGFSSIQASYVFTDQAPSNGVSYYRLQIVDRDGKFKYSQVRAVRTSLVNGLSVFPNPANDFVGVSLGNDVTGDLTIRLVNLSGQLLEERKLSHAGGTTVTFSLQSYPQGNYVLQIMGTDGTRLTQKLIINR
jgi:hypothetical protein